MLLQLEIQNIALIDKLSLEIGQGLNVLTGETGAGKSIIIDSINALLGERVSKDIIRTGKDRALVQGVFFIDHTFSSDISSDSNTMDANSRENISIEGHLVKGSGVRAFLEQNGIHIEEDGTLIISREVSQSGRNVCRINGNMVTVSVLKELGSMLIDVHGQHDNQSLLNIDSHIELLDAFGGKQIHELNEEYFLMLKARKEKRKKLESLSGAGKDRERKIDLLKYQIEEIKAANLKKGEEEKLAKQRLLASGSEKIIASLSLAYEDLYEGKAENDGLMDVLNKCALNISSISKFDSKYEDISKRIYEVTYLLEDICETLRNERDSIEFNPNELEKLDERLDNIFKLKKKYGNNIDEIINYLKTIELELEELINNEELVVGLSKEIQLLEKNMFDICKKLSLERLKCAKILEDRIVGELRDLEMKRADFKVNIDFQESATGICNYTSKGLDKVEFLFSANVGEPLKPLNKIASGGEMSRVMLAIKSILADVDSIPTLIFDEIDTGISGVAAQKVGEKLALISKHHQVLCVTHLAQIASMADNHYVIEKISDEKSTYTNVRHLMVGETAVEIARIIGGSTTSEITLKHAEAILEEARSLKSKS